MSAVILPFAAVVKRTSSKQAAAPVARSADVERRADDPDFPGITDLIEFKGEGE